MFLTARKRGYFSEAVHIKRAHYSTNELCVVSNMFTCKRDDVALQKFHTLQRFKSGAACLTRISHSHAQCGDLCRKGLKGEPRANVLVDHSDAVITVKDRCNEFFKMVKICVPRTMFIGQLQINVVMEHPVDQTIINGCCRLPTRIATVRAYDDIFVREVGFVHHRYERAADNTILSSVLRIALLVYSIPDSLKRLHKRTWYSAVIIAEINVKTNRGNSSEAFVHVGPILGGSIHTDS